MKPILLLPGMGADRRLHGKLRPRHAIRPIDWPPFRPGGSLADYARSLIEREGIAAGDVIGGTSMGGMLALEIANQVRLRRVLLIASAASWRQVSPRLRRLSRLSPIAPFDLLALTPPLPMFPGGQRLIAEMARHAAPAFLRWACGALARWDGYHGDPALIRRIHGTRDRVIPPWGRPDVVVPGGGHLIALTHPAVVADFIDAHAG
jgi:pimeloyl-ACP methyl ester carboxylesterase